MTDHGRNKSGCQHERFDPNDFPMTFYGLMISANRLVRTRMPGGVGAGGENPPATRFSPERSGGVGQSGELPPGFSPPRSGGENARVRSMFFATHSIRRVRTYPRLIYNDERYFSLPS